ncbi:MAG: hypothetical protein AAB933_03155 [Patescibacteria group bacterium]
MQYLYILETGLGKDKPPVEFSAGNHVFAREYAKKEGGIRIFVEIPLSTEKEENTSPLVRDDASRSIKISVLHK